MIEILGAAARWFQLTANLIILGSCVFLALAGINKRVYTALWVEKLERLFPRLAIGILIGLIVTIAATIIQITGDVHKLLEIEALSHFIAGTRTGTMWAAQFALAVLLWIAVMLIRKSSVRASWRYTLTAVIAIFPLIADALVSHAAAEGMAMTNILPYALHIILAGVWLGGLPALLLLKYEYVKQEKSKRANVFDSHILKRFSSVALPVMLLIMATGIFVSDRIFDGNYATLVATPYGWLLLAKLALLGIILIIASSVRAYWLPRFTNSKSSDETRSSATGMRKWVRIEFLWAVVLVLIATILANNATPAKYALIEEWPFSFRFSIIATWNTDNVPILVWSGLILVVAAFGVLQYGRRSAAWNLKRLIIIPFVVFVLGLAVALPPLTIEAYPETYRKPPVPFDVISIAYGAQNFAEHCVECHGHQGKGDGIKARTLSTVLPDMLTEPHTVEHTPGDFYHWITYGMKNTDMPGYKDELTEEDRWDLVNYVFALSRGYQARILSPEVIPNRANVQPPVFSYNAHDGSSGALQDFRGNKPVLLVIFSWPYSQARIAQLKAAYTALAAQNIQILVVPAHELEAHVLAEITQDMPYPVVTDTAREITQSYALSRRTMSHPDLLGRGSIPDHMEYLIDRSGYLRARWIPSAEETGWKDIDLLIKQVKQLNTENLSVVPAKDFL